MNSNYYYYYKIQFYVQGGLIQWSTVEPEARAVITVHKWTSST